MTLIFVRIRFHIKASIVLTRADHYYIHNYIRSLLNIILRPILMVQMGLESYSTTHVSDTLYSSLSGVTRSLMMWYNEDMGSLTIQDNEDMRSLMIWDNEVMR